jgi:4a-hydroxytetrahydrobiopterin dehydratase
MSDSPTDDSITAAEFHNAPGVSAWRITGHGTDAVYRARSLAHAASLVDAVVTAADAARLTVDIDVRPDAIRVSIPWLGGEGVPAAASGFAAEVSRAASERGLTENPAAVQSIGIYVAQHSGADVRPFFLAALGYDPLGEGDAVDPLRRGPGLAFNPITGDAAGRGRTHVDVYVPADQAQARVDAALAAGGRLVDDTNAPAFWSLASPENHGVDIAAWPDGGA